MTEGFYQDFGIQIPNMKVLLFWAPEITSYVHAIGIPQNMFNTCPEYSTTRHSMQDQRSIVLLFIGLADQGKDIVFRFIIEYSSLRDFGP